MAEWWESHEQWTGWQSLLFGEERLAAAPAEVEGLVELVRPAPAARVLDLPCGPGRHSLELARRGYRVTAVDLTPEYLDAGRRQAARDSLEIEWVEADMRHFDRPGAFDVALNLWTSLGYFERPEQNADVVRRLARSLAPGGVLVLELKGREAFENTFRAERVFEHAGVEITERSRWIEPGRCEAEWSAVVDGTPSTYRFRTWVYDRDALRGMLADAGLSSVEFFGGFDGHPYDPSGESSGRLVAVARS